MLKHDANSVLVFNDELANQANFFTGSYNTLKLDFDPLIGGYSFFKWISLPQWVTKTFPGFRAMTEKNFLEGFSINDIELETTSITHGFAANEYNVATTIKKGNTDFNIKHREFSGSPIRNAYQFWITGIRDPESGIATYCKTFGTDYAAKNHTGEVCYIETRPDANNVDTNNIEYSCYYSAVLPTKIQLSQFSFSHGSHDAVEYDQSFKGVFHMGKHVDQFAKTVLASKVYGITEMNDFDPLDPESPSGTEFTMSDVSVDTPSAESSSSGFVHDQGELASEFI